MSLTTRAVPGILAFTLSVLGTTATSSAQVIETWSQSDDLGGAVTSQGRAIGVLSNGDLVVTANIDSPPTGASSIVLRRIQPDGTLVWSTTIDDPAPVTESATRLRVDAQDSIYLGGFDFVPQSAGSSSGTRRSRVWKVDAAGGLVWSVASLPGANGAYLSLIHI